MHSIIKDVFFVSLKADNYGVCRKLAVMTGTVLSVTAVDQWSTVPDVGGFIIQIASLLRTALKKPFSHVQFVRFVTLNMTVVYRQLLITLFQATFDIV